MILTLSHFSLKLHDSGNRLSWEVSQLSLGRFILYKHMPDIFTYKELHKDLTGNVSWYRRLGDVAQSFLSQYITVAM